MPAGGELIVGDCVFSSVGSRVVFSFVSDCGASSFTGSSFETS